jgi:hypothetical protein
VKEEKTMTPCFPESSLSEALSDPLIRAVMAADRVDPRELESGLRDIARQLDSRRRGARHPVS